MRITLKHNSTSLTVEATAGASISDIALSYASTLRLPESYKVTNSEGDRVNSSDVAQDGETYVFEKSAPDKGSR